MAEERADALVEFGADDVLEFAGLIVGFGIFDGECVLEQSFGQAVAAHDVAGSARARVGQLDVAVEGLHQLQFDHAAQHARGGFIGDQRQSFLQGPVGCSASTRAGFPSSPKIQICSRR